MYHPEYIKKIADSIQSAASHHLTVESNRAEQPAWIRTPLRPHQQTLLSAALDLETRVSTVTSLSSPTLLSDYGVLADRVGAGKSLVALSLVRAPTPRPYRIKYEDGGAACYVRMTNSEPVDVEVAETPTALLICSHTIVHQWKAYIRDQTDLRATFVTRKRECAQQADISGDIVVVTSTMAREFTYNNTVTWSRCFVDEADTIPLTATRVKARFFWFITGSWLNLLFSTGLRHSAVQALPSATRGLVGDGAIQGVTTRSTLVRSRVATTPRFGALILRNTDAWINTSLTAPTIHHETVLCLAPATVDVIREFVSPAVLEAIHAGDTAGAIAALGLSTVTKQTVVERVTEKLQAELNDAVHLLAFKQGLTMSSPAAKEAAIQKATAKVARLQERLDALLNRIEDDAESTRCPICYESPPQTPTMTPCCQQSFCFGCICECLGPGKGHAQCPLCRAVLASPKELLVVGSTPASTEPMETESLPTKNAALLALLANSTPDQRILVFSAYEASFRGLKEYLGAKHGIRCEPVTGTSAHIQRLCANFGAGKVRVLCLNARNVGAGLNLESATHVVMFHRMNVELERQVIGRAVRFERTTDLTVVHLVHEGETTNACLT